MSRNKRAARRRSPLAKVCIGLGCCLALLLGLSFGLLLYVGHHLDSQIHRIHGTFAGLDHRPSRATGTAAGAENILLLGTDGRTTKQTTGSDATAGWTPGAQRSDTMMVLHIAAGGGSASVISLPRDSWVPVPGYGTAKINAAFSYGGPRLAVETVEQLTNVRIDHIAWVDWAGFRQLTDTLGGVDVYVPQTVYDSARNVTWTRGTHHLDGAQALTYVRQRHGLLGGDLDRVKRQQYFLRSLLASVRQQVSLTSPRTSYRILDAVTQNLTVDAEFSTGDLRSLASTMARIPARKLTFLTAPVAGFGREGSQSVVYLDDGEGRGLWRAVRADRVGDWVSSHHSDVTGRIVG